MEGVAAVAEGHDWGDSFVVEDGLVEVSWDPRVLVLGWWVLFFEDGDDGVSDGWCKEWHVGGGCRFCFVLYKSYFVGI